MKRKKQLRKGVKIQQLSMYATDEERHDYNARVRNIGRRKANTKRLLSILGGKECKYKSHAYFILKTT